MPAELTREPVADDADLPRGFPEGFGAGGEERAATLVLVSLLGIAPKRLHALAWAEGTASGCLAAIRSGAFDVSGIGEIIAFLPCCRPFGLPS